MDRTLRERGLVASMRPRHRCRGRHDPPEELLLAATRFNEAAASMPRKTWLRRLCVDLRSARFNEAAASMPRKTSGDQDRLTQPLFCCRSAARARTSAPSVSAADVPARCRRPRSSHHRRSAPDRPTSIVAPNRTLQTTIPLKRKWRRRPATATPPSRLEQVALLGAPRSPSSLESALVSRARVRAAI